MNPKISIITPCYNAANYIEQTIRSIIDQGYEQLEYIIIDGGSSDGTVDIIRKYEDKLAYWISEPDKGQSDAINKGIAVATGDVFNWVNADDWLEPDSLALIGKYFKDPAVNIVCTQTKFLKPDRSTYINETTHFEGDVREVLNTRGLNQMGMYWRLKLIKDLNGVNTAFRYAMDLDLWKRYLLTFGNQNIVKDEMITGVFRLHSDSKTGSDMFVNASFFDKENNAALCQYANLVGQKYVDGIRFLHPTIDEDLAAIKPVSNIPTEKIKEWMNDHFYNKGTRYFYADDFKNAYKILRCIDPTYLTYDECKNFKSFKRWSYIRQVFKIDSCIKKAVINDIQDTR